MESDPRVWIETLRRSHDRLTGLVKPLSPEELREQSYCSDWSVAQVAVAPRQRRGDLAHDAAGRAGRGGAGQPGRVPGRLGRWNGKSPDDQAADALTADEAQISTLEGRATSSSPGCR